MLNVPLQVTPNQIIKTVLGGQNCQIKLYQKAQGLFFDLNADGTDIVTGILCHETDFLVCIQYTGFLGNLFFIDTKGDEDPTYDEFGTRYFLVYLTADEYELVV